MKGLCQVPPAAGAGCKARLSRSCKGTRHLAPFLSCTACGCTPTSVVKHTAHLPAHLSAGKDTNGSQFFICTVKTPWLVRTPVAAASAGLCRECRLVPRVPAWFDRGVRPR